MAPKADVDGYLVTRNRRIRYVYGSARAGDIIPAGAARMLHNFDLLVADGTLQLDLGAYTRRSRYAESAGVLLDSPQTRSKAR